jgi:hypothetical protein
MKTTREIRNELVRLLGTIRVDENGYQNSFDPEKIYGYWSAKIASDMRDETYPKTFVIANMGQSENRIGEEIFKNLQFTIIHVVKKIKSDQDQISLMDSYLEDLEKFFELNYSISGFVNMAEIVEFITDGGTVEKESVLVCTVKTERSKYGTSA